MSGMEISNFWCYQCNSAVRSRDADDICCPICSGGFLEEIQSPNPNPLPPLHGETPSGENLSFTGNVGAAAGGDDATAGGGAQPEVNFPRLGTNVMNSPGGNPAMFQFLEAMYAFLQQVQPQPFAEEAMAGRQAGPQTLGSQALETGLFNPTLVMQGTLQNFLGGGGNVEITFDNGTGAGPRVLPGNINIGDYFFGRGLRQLIQRLAENDPNLYGTSPASKSAIESLPTIRIAEEHLGSDYVQCAVCKDEFDLGAEVRKMPCKHIYHGECILPWLSQHNSCPVCRHELPTDDQQDSTAPTSGPSAGSESNRGGDRGMGRAFRVWGSHESGLPAENPFTTTNANLSSQEVGPQSDVARGRAEQEGGSGGITRRISFQLPWPFRFANTGSATQSETSGSGDMSQGVRPLNTQTGDPSNLAPTSDVPRAVGRNGDDVDGEREREHLD